MDKLVVVSVQQRLRLPATEEEHLAQLRRFMRAAANKHARLVVFPAIAGLMVVPPLLRDLRATLLKRADRGRSGRASLRTKAVGGLASAAARLLRASFAASLAGILDVDAGAVWDAYLRTFGGLAREFGVTLVAPSCYLPDPRDGTLRHLATVFSPSGALLGTQANVMLSEEDQRYCKAGATWDVIHTEAGALGLMLGNDVLYPEVGRVLAFQGAEILVAQGACVTPAAFSKHRNGVLARMQDNQIYAVSAYVVGPDPFLPAGDAPYMGKAAILAPQELTPRFNGVLVEMGNHTSEGVLSAEWEFPQLKELWEKGDMPLRRALPDNQAHKMLAALYAHLQGTPRLADGTPAVIESAIPTAVALDDLPIIASVTSRWPLHAGNRAAPPTQETVSEWHPEQARVPFTPLPAGKDHEEETDEMDALDDAAGAQT